MRRLVLALALLALVAAGCGNAPRTGTDSAQEGSAVADTEGIYLDINHLKYQIELSRYINPNDVEDAQYLKGLPKGETASANETWFGVWVRVQNVTDQTHPAADNWEIRDTLGHVFRPVPLDTNVNVFAFEKGVDVPPHTVLPLSSTAAGQGPIQGSLLLFKIKDDSLQNRPLELRFTNGQQGGGTGVYDLDV
jgi:predicted small secreted protein